MIYGGDLGRGDFVTKKKAHSKEYSESNMAFIL